MRRLLLILLLGFLWPAAARAETGNEALARGAQLAQKHDYAGAIAAYKKAIELKAAPPVALYNLACVYALAGKTDDAIATLKQAAAAGFRSLETMNSDADLASLRKDPRWPEVVAAVEKVVYPCKDAAISRQLDFWVGEWNVFAGPRHVGESSVVSILGSCVVLEQWKGDLGGTGKSFNFYDAGQKHWRQTWVDDSGGNQDFAGDYSDKAMRYLGKDRRLTFFDLPDGKVRQLAEVTADGGKTWTTQYDFIYIRKK